MSREISTGLIGFGLAGEFFHAPFIADVPGLRLSKVVERKSSRSKDKYPWIEAVKDAEEIFADEGIELVVVATPNATHFEMAKRALEAGKNVVVDKPFVTSLEEAEELIELSKHTGKILCVYQNRRWDGGFLTAKKVIESGVLGELVEYKCHFDRFRNFVRENSWKEESAQGVGMTFDLGSHLIDQALCLFGMPSYVTADIRTMRKGSKVDDFFEITLDYIHMRAVLRATMLSREEGPHFILNGTEGSYVKYGADPQEQALRSGHTPGLPGWGAEPEDKWGILNASINGLNYRGAVETVPGAYQEFYKNIYAAIADGVELAVKPEEALNSLRVIKAAMESSRNRSSIRMELGGGLVGKA